LWFKFSPIKTDGGRLLVDSATYDKSLTYLYDLQKYGIKFGLSSTSNLLERLGNPHNNLRAIHIAGTNGKGSTAAMLSAILVRAGMQVGLYTSPHLVRFNERFRLNEQDVDDRGIMDVFRRVKEVVDEREPPTFFEMTTAMALSLFAEKEVDWSILEVGMGGRLDATNVIQPQITIINNVAFDHQEFLGFTLGRIAREKAGIIKKGIPLITAAKQPVALAVIKERCLALNVPCYRVGQQIKVRSQGKYHFSYQGLKWRLENLHLPLAGRHQLLNAATALGALEVLEHLGHLHLTTAQVREGLKNTRWPGRLEWYSEQPPVLLDGAHNNAGIVALRKALQEEYTFKRLILVLGIMADKDLRGMLHKLAPLAEHIILTRPKYERAAEPEALRKMAGEFAARTELIRSVRQALKRAITLATSEDLVVVTGSLYFIGEVKEIKEEEQFMKHPG
jgi:dihydrofolate synthase/folylpolyglutamate synthase